jgi:homeobox protein Nkx-3.2
LVPGEFFNFTKCEAEFSSREIYQNRRYKTKRKQIQQHEAALIAASKRVPVQVLVRDDGSYCRMMNPGPGYSPNTIDPALFNKLNLTDIYRQQVRKTF